MQATRAQCLLELEWRAIVVLALAELASQPEHAALLVAVVEL
jgi:hypothetical protein